MVRSTAADSESHDIALGDKLTDGGQLYLLVIRADGRHWRMDRAFGRNAAGSLKLLTLSLSSYPAITLIETRLRRD